MFRTVTLAAVIATVCVLSRNLNPSQEFVDFEAAMRAGADATLDAYVRYTEDIVAFRPGFDALFGSTVPVIEGSEISDFQQIRKAKEKKGRTEINIATVCYGDACDRELEDGVILYLHGGGFLVGSLDAYGGMMSYLSRDIGLPLVYVNYSLAPETPMPAAVEECVYAYEYLLEEEEICPEKIILMGDSAGGGLVLLSQLMIRDEGLPQPAGAVSFSPVTDLSLSGETCASQQDNDVLVHPSFYDQLWARHGTNNQLALRDSSVSALYNDYSGITTKNMFLTGQNERILSDSLNGAAQLRAGGVDLHFEVAPFMLHDYPLFGDIFPEATDGRMQVKAWLEEEVGTIFGHEGEEDCFEEDD